MILCSFIVCWWYTLDWFMINEIKIALSGESDMKDSEKTKRILCMYMSNSWLCLHMLKDLKKSSMHESKYVILPWAIHFFSSKDHSPASDEEEE